MHSTIIQKSARNRIIEVAIEVFTEHGYEHATLREICRRAGVNNAAVNYHFRDKEQLYSEVIDFAVGILQDTSPERGIDWSAPPEEQLRAYIRSVLGGLLDESRPSWLIKLMSREMAKPQIMELVVEKAIGPSHSALLKIIKTLIGPCASERQIQNCAFSVGGQCFMYYHSKAMVDHLATCPIDNVAAVEHLIEHVFQFSLAGINAIRAVSREV